jgi:hypothetical protein
LRLGKVAGPVGGADMGADVGYGLGGTTGAVAGGQSLSPRLLVVVPLSEESGEERPHLHEVSDCSVDAVVGADSGGLTLETAMGELRAIALVRKSV